MRKTQLLKASLLKWDKLKVLLLTVRRKRWICACLVMMQTIFLELIAAVLIKAESAAPPLQSVVI